MSKKVTSIALCSLMFFSFFVVDVPENTDAQVTEEWVARNKLGSIIFDMTLDAAGFVYVTGYNMSAQSDCVTACYDPFGNELWTARYNGPGNGSDCLRAIAVDSYLGRVYVTGQSESIGTFWDYTTIAYDLSGNELWVARYNYMGNSGDQAFDIALDSSGRIYVTGGSFNQGTDYDYATIAYDSSGNELWITRYNSPGNSYDAAWAIALDESSGNVYVTGSSGTVAYDSSGNELWVEGGYQGVDIDVDSSGNVYVTGSIPISLMNTDYITVVYASSGTKLWDNTYNGPRDNWDGAKVIAVDESLGNVYVTGCINHHSGYQDIKTIAYDIYGNELWNATYNGPANDRDDANSIITDDSGNIYVTGWLSDLPGQGEGDDILTIKYDSMGNEVWMARYNSGENRQDWGIDNALDPFGNVYVTGHANWDFITIKYSQGSTNRPPVADAMGPYSYLEGQTAGFFAGRSDDPDGDSLLYRWDFDSDGTWDTGWSDLFYALHPYGDDYSGEVVLQVSDGGFPDVNTATISVSNVGPSANAGPDKTVTIGDIVSFTGNYTDPGWLDTHIYEWDFGDGNTQTGTLTPTHTYYNKGVYTVKFTVTDDDGGVGQDSCEITVNLMQATITIDPDTLNLKSKGRWITCYIDLPGSYDVNDIDTSTVILEDVIPAERGDIQNTALMVKFDRSEVEDFIRGPDESFELTVTGELIDGTKFEGSDIIRVIEPP